MAGKQALSLIDSVFVLRDPQISVDFPTTAQDHQVLLAAAQVVAPTSAYASCRQAARTLQADICLVHVALPWQTHL